MIRRKKLYPIDETVLPIDPLIRDLVYKLRAEGISTVSSCQGGEHSSDTMAWILFQAKHKRDLVKLSHAMERVGFRGILEISLIYSPDQYFAFGTEWYGMVKMTHEYLVCWGRGTG